LTLLNRLLARDHTYRHQQTGEIQDVSYLPFIFERSFSTYLHMNPGIKGLAYPFTREEVLAHCYSGEIERTIVTTFGDVIDEIDKRREYNSDDRRIIFSLHSLRAAAARYGWP
jgi:hypothetical protein